ncbi:hypothetical protein F5B22DRAFT_613392 [Xylaria bambusicola]|uniref:uncharacterized protein n=1 Tax=Xylaria bambusicola TaxID=326684 RepID=UPI0020076C2A|nr:uncharacterized protein F5B22DRAFT_613392 [Xylaria bambusicola]KAI0513074.1 hypothetical protein F5B22DRAFT_613392 [Xylaria bambusicola]
MIFYSISLLVYRDNAAGEREILVRYLASEAMVLSQALEPGKEPIHCAQRLAMRHLGVYIPYRDLSRNASVTVERAGDARGVQVFLVPSTAQIEALTQQETQGWRYSFLPLSSMTSLWLTPEIAVDRESLEYTALGIDQIIPPDGSLTAEIVSP